MSGYAGNSEMVFYMVGDTIYRYHVRSRQTDAIYQGSGIVTWYPITSKVLLIGKNNGITASPLAPPVCTNELDLEGLAYYRIDTESKEARQAVDPEHLVFLTKGLGYTHLSSYSSMINGTTIPLSNYPIGSAFTSYYNKFWLEAQHPAGLLSVSCLSYNKGSNWLTITSLGFYVRMKDCQPSPYCSVRFEQVEP